MGKQCFSLWITSKVHLVTLFVCFLHDASGHSNVLKAGKAEDLKNARRRRTARKANKLRVCPQGYKDVLRLGLPVSLWAGWLRLSYHYG